MHRKALGRSSIRIASSTQEGGEWLLAAAAVMTSNADEKLITGLYLRSTPLYYASTQPPVASEPLATGACTDNPTCAHSLCR